MKLGKTVLANVTQIKSAKKLMKKAGIGLISTMFSIGIIGPAIESVDASSRSCSGRWEINAIAYLTTQLGHLPDDVACYSMWEGESDTASIRFKNSGNYAIAAECDEDCGDVDIRLYNAAGDLVAKDTSTSSFARVNFYNIDAGDRYTAKVTMYDCDTWVCSAAIGTARQ